MILFGFVRTLVITEIIEIIIAFFLGWRGKRFYTALILINVITNPILNCILMILNSFNINNLVYAPILEFLVVIVEWKLFEYALGKCQNKYFSLSLTINLSSYLLGVIYLSKYR